MDSDRRHELQHNSLDNELSAIIEFIKKNANKILTGLIVVLVILIAWVLIGRKIETNRMNIQTSYENLRKKSVQPNADIDELINGYVELSNQSSVDWIAADSLIRMGQLHTKKAITSKNPKVIKQYYFQAESCYNKAINDYSDSPETVAYATLGLGKIAEDKGDYKKAAQYFEKIMNDKKLAGYPVAEQAKNAYNTCQKYSAEKARLAEVAPAWVKEADKVSEAMIPKPEKK